MSFKYISVLVQAAMLFSGVEGFVNVGERASWCISNLHFIEFWISV